MSTSAGRIKHDGDSLLLDHLGLVTKGGLQIIGIYAEERSNNGKDILVLDSGERVGTFVGEATAVSASGTGVTGALEFKLANVENSSKHLANLGNVIARKLELLEGRLEELEAFGIIDTDLELGWVTKVLPTGGAGNGRVVEAKMGLFGGACSGQQIVQGVKVAFTSGNICDSASFQSVVEELTANEDGVGCGGRVVLQLVKETRLGSSWGGGGLCRREGIEDVGRERKFVGKGS